ncbi:MAG: DUF2169 domain-containing protein [Gammaproteobacteria bacterium]|nr:DUF2169 domain-containing protein [Gammaproteobacteria bacterium]
MLQLRNNTPFAADTILLPNEEGIDTLYIVVKATFNIGEQWTLADEQTPPAETDEYWGEAENSSIKYASDYHTGKPGSDIIMLGHAFATDKKEVPQMDVSLTVGQVHKTIRVFGDRHWQDGRISLPKPFRTMAMTYEKAYGGTHIVDEQIKETEERNPVGCGFSGQRKTEEMNGLPLPNLEDPDNLVSSPKQRPAPACFAISAPHWSPRSGFAGTYDENWKTRRIPYIPTDFDPRFFNMAHADLIYPGFLQGGEPVEITNMHPHGHLKFTVPAVKLRASVTVAGNILKPEFDLETLMIEPNRLKLSMVWRAAMPCNKTALKISDITLNTTR